MYVRPTGLLLLALCWWMPGSGCALAPEAGSSTNNDSSDQVSPAVISPSVDGYWFIQELGEGDAHTDSSVFDYLYFRTTDTVDGQVRFEITDACNKDEVLARGELTSEGAIHLIDEAGGYIRTYAEFSDDHEFVGDWIDGHRVHGQRIEEPDCQVRMDGTIGVQVHDLEYVVEPDEGFIAAAAKVRHRLQEEEEQLQGSTQQGAVPNGLEHLEAARGDRLPLGDSFEHPNADSSDACQDQNGNPVDPCPQAPDGGHVGFVECSAQNWTESRIQQLADVIALGDSDAIYPGALVQGASFAAGGFTPITIPRAAGRLTLSGLTLAGPGLCPGLSTPYTACVDTVERAEVTDAIARILQNSEVQGTVADAALNIEQVYSAEHFALKFGIDVSATGLPANIGGNLHVDQQSSENLVVLQFNQVFYSVAFEAPRRPFSVFQDGESFDDPENQIGEDNPPLYVSNVKYGRQVYLFLRSSYGAALVEAALKGAISAEAATVKIDGNLTYQDVMSRTRVSYVVRGGDAGLALAPIDAASAENPNALYDAIRSLLANRQAATFSAGNPGIPISYTLRYLVDNKVASTSYEITYDRRDCRTYPAQDYKYTLRIANPKASAWVYLDNTKTLIAGPYRSGTGVVDLDLNSFLTDAGDHTLIIQVYARCLWESSYARFTLSVDGAPRWRDGVDKGHFATCQFHNLLGSITTLFPNQAFEARLAVSRRTGKVQLLGLAK